MTIQGMVFDLQRFSLHDGPGIRTTVFLKGCPLHCQWCHNPESQCRPPEVAFAENLCQQCGECFAACPSGAQQWIHGRHIFQRHLCQQAAPCNATFACVDACSFEALKKTGSYESAGEIIREVVRDQNYYKQSGGGITLSGGEPLAQPAFTRELLLQSKALGIHTSIETSGYASKRVIQSLMPLVDLWLYDIKATHLDTHKTLTGVTNSTILRNLSVLYENGAAIWLRFPMIPGVNDSLDHIQGISLLSRRFPRIEHIEIMPFHATAAPKYARYGRVYPLPELPSADGAYIGRILAHLKENGCERARIS
jgi:glycyl-radical enzyme activating protein